MVEKIGERTSIKGSLIEAEQSSGGCIHIHETIVRSDGD
jgi:hypothetical protein